MRYRQSIGPSSQSLRKYAQTLHRFPSCGLQGVLFVPTPLPVLLQPDAARRRLNHAV